MSLAKCRAYGFFQANSVFSSRKALPADRIAILTAFQKKAQLKFKDLSLLDLAFQHRSFAYERHGSVAVHNERLEFLGDAILGAVVASFLYRTMSESREGELARIKAVVVSEATLARCARALGIDACLKLGHGEELSGGRGKKAILADCLEAVIGAYYLDAGFHAAEQFVLSFIAGEIQAVQENRGYKDYKTLLQEFSQKTYRSCPRYHLMSASGPDHDRSFEVEVFVGDRAFGPARGKSKKEAEQEAARLAWQGFDPSL